ncbi:protein kinase-like protein [Leishmania panamensis]|uniref:Protein kinase-like protein, putative n=1 Tax=Leishmania panamensis TaxID=5679 RepID=A0A088SCW5_LEIPA|nr:protein kinase-like protein [Leishmania panamensis]AIN99556.1 protein kinase-like protein [Leishmania panamensis]
MTSRGEHLRLEKGSVVKNHYEVITPIGTGNFSKVYRVIDLQLPVKEQQRKPLAMKVIKKEYSSDAKYEKQMLIVLHEHDGGRNARVSKMYECFVWQECPVFIMPMHGPSLRSRRLGVNRGIVTHEKLLEFSYNLLETMGFVHFECHMVHTDLKPENILIADRNVAENSMGNEWVVCDFGSASLWRMDKLDSDLISTRPYRAPEVVLGNKWHYAADMWSVGCILYEVAVGHRLFETRDDLTHLHMMDRRLGRLPEAFVKHSKYSSRYFNSHGDFVSTPDVIRFSKCRLTPIREVFRYDREFLHLLKGLLTYIPDERMTSAEALALPMFDALRAARKERQRLADATAEAQQQQRRRFAGAAILGNGMSPRPTDSSDNSALDHTVDGARKNDRSSSVHHGRGAAEVQSLSARSSSTIRDISSTDDMTAVADGAKNNHSSHRQHHHNHKRGETNSSNVAGSRSETHPCMTSVPAQEMSAASPTVSATSPFSDLAAGGTSREATARMTTVATAVAPVTAGSISRSATSSVMAPYAASPGKKRSSKARETRRRATSTPVVRSGGNQHSRSPSPGAGVLTEEVPSPHPVVNNHQSTSTGRAALVPQLALEHVKASALASDGAATPLSSQSGRRRSGRSARKLSGRIMSPATKSSMMTPHKGLSSGSQHGCGRSAAGGGSTKLDVTSPLKSPRQHLQLDLSADKRRNRTPPHSSSTACCLLETLSPTITRSPRMTKASLAAGPAQGLIISMPDANTTPPQTVFRAGAPPNSSTHRHSLRKPATMLGSISDHSITKENEAGVTTTLRLGPSVAASTEVTQSAAATELATLHRLSESPNTPLGYRAPLQRDITAVGMCMRTESLAVLGSPNVDDERHDVDHIREGRSEAATGDGDGGCKRVGSQTVTCLAATKNDDVDNVSADNSDKDNPSVVLPTKLFVSTPSSPINNRLSSTYNSDGSPHTTDYRSPVRCRPPMEGTSNASSPVMINTLNARFSTPSSEWRDVEVAKMEAIAAAMVKEGRQPFATALGPPLPQSQRNLFSAQRSHRHRSPRECSPAARSSSFLAGRQSPTRGPITPLRTVPEVTSNEDPHELASTVPLSHDSAARANSSSLLGGMLNAASVSKADLQSHMMPPSAGTTPAAGRSARRLSMAMSSTSATTTSKLTTPTHVGQTPSVPSQFTVVMTSADKLKSVSPFSVSEMRKPMSPPLTASQRAVIKPGRTPAAPVPAPVSACPSVEELIPMTLRVSATTSHPAVTAPRSHECSLSLKDGRLVNANSTVNPQLLTTAPTSPVGTIGVAAVLHQPLHRPYQPAHGLVYPSDSSSHVLSEAKMEEAGSAAASQSLGLHMARGSLVLQDRASPPNMSSQLPVIGAATAATAPPSFVLSRTTHGADERREALSHNSSNASAKLLNTQHTRTSPDPSLRCQRSSLCINIAPDVTAGTKSLRSATAVLTNASTSSRLNSSFKSGGTSKSGLATLSYPAALSGSAGSASFQSVSRSPRNPVAHGTTGINSLRSSTDGVSVTSARSPRNGVSLAASPKPSATYRRPGSPRGISPVLITTDLLTNAIGGNVMSTPMQLLQQPPSQTKMLQRSSAAVASTDAGLGKTSISIVPRYTQSGVTLLRSPMHQQSIGASVAATSRPQAQGLAAGPVNPMVVADSVASLKQPYKASFVAIKSVNSRGSTTDGSVNTISVDALSELTRSKPKHRRDPRTLRRISAPRPSTFSLSQANGAVSSLPTTGGSDGGDEDGDGQTRGAFANSVLSKPHDRDTPRCTSATEVSPPKM